MQMLAYRSLFLAIWSNQHQIKSISPLSKITQIIYPYPQLNTQPPNTTNPLAKKARCWLCNSLYDHVLMLIMHLEVMHPGLVDKYQIRNQVLAIVVDTGVNAGKDKDRQKMMETERIDSTIAGGNLVGFARSAGGISKNSYGMQFTTNINFIDNSPASLKNRHITRVRAFVSNIILKLQKTVVKTQQIYFHSSNIFKRVQQDQLEQDSQDDIGQVQRQLQKLRIQDFSDVNDNDKKFFILWNSFIHDSRKRLSMIYLHDMPNLFISFSQLAQKQGIPRINLVMHAWTLWSVGQISSGDVVKGLSQYDQFGKAKVEGMAGRKIGQGDGLAEQARVKEAIMRESVGK